MLLPVQDQLAQRGRPDVRHGVELGDRVEPVIVGGAGDAVGSVAMVEQRVGRHRVQADRIDEQVAVGSVDEGEHPQRGLAPLGDDGTIGLSRAERVPLAVEPGLARATTEQRADQRRERREGTMLASLSSTTHAG
jgi:hypothetical protein